MEGERRTINRGTYDVEDEVSGDDKAPDGTSKLLRHYGCGLVAFTGADDALYERRLLFDHVIDPKSAKPREQFEAVSWAIRDVLSQRWLKTLQHHDRSNPKQVYYLSMEFLIGRSLDEQCHEPAPFASSRGR